MVTNVTSLLKTVKAVEDEATKGTRALESTIEHIRQELAVSNALLTSNSWSLTVYSVYVIDKQHRNQIPASKKELIQNSVSLMVPCSFTWQVFSSSDPPPNTTTPEEFIRMTKGITMATAKAVAAGNSCRQEDIIATANLSRRAIADMLHSCKVQSWFIQLQGGEGET